MGRRILVTAIAAAVAVSSFASAAPTAGKEGIPHYDHVFVILEENKDYEQVMSPATAPNIAALAAKFPKSA